MKNLNKKTTKEPKAKKDMTKLIGALQLFVLASIVFSTYVVFVGVENWVMRGLLFPQAVYALVLAVQKFTK